MSSENEEYPLISATADPVIYYGARFERQILDAQISRVTRPADRIVDQLNMRILATKHGDKLTVGPSGIKSYYYTSAGNGWHQVSEPKTEEVVIDF